MSYKSNISVSVPKRTGILNFNDSLFLYPITKITGFMDMPPENMNGTKFYECIAVIFITQATV
jgi:proton glutamate symport protein